MQSLSSAQQLIDHYPRFFSNGRVHVQIAGVLIDNTDNLATPYFHFKICLDNLIVGAVNLRLTKNKKIVECYGHLGFEVAKAYRGRNLAFQACELVAPFIRVAGFRRIIITCHPSNTASRKTIERLGSRFIMYRNFSERCQETLKATESLNCDNERLIYCWDLN